MVIKQQMKIWGLFFKIGVSCLLITLHLTGVGQNNLVPNGSFELLSDCPEDKGNKLLHESNVEVIKGNWEWINFNNEFQSFLANTCILSNADTLSEQLKDIVTKNSAHIGTGYVAMPFYIKKKSPHPSEVGAFMQVKLTDTLLHGRLYYLEFFVKPVVKNGIRTNGFGALCVKGGGVTDENYKEYLHDNQPEVKQKPNVVVKDWKEWTRVSGYILAEGGENTLIIGNFLSEGELKYSNDFWKHFYSEPVISYYYLFDSVSLFEVDALGLPKQK